MDSFSQEVVDFIKKSLDTQNKGTGWCFTNVLPVNEPGPLPGLHNPRDDEINENDEEHVCERCKQPKQHLTTYEYQNLLEKMAKCERTVMALGSTISLLEEEHVRIKKNNLCRIIDLERAYEDLQKK